MYLVLRPDRDAYITNRVIKNVSKTSSNTGAAGSLDLFKLVCNTLTSSSKQLSRLLVHFNLDDLRAAQAAGELDTNNASFNTELKLFDVYGGQTTPSNFTVVCNPLSRSFEEGLGRDVLYYVDSDVCNFLSCSRTGGAWLSEGCSLGGGELDACDYISSSYYAASQRFVVGDEDLSIDVTAAVSATLAGTLPDEGYRIAYAGTHEDDDRSYFVKRFAGRAAFNNDKRPRLIVRYDDSVQDDSTSAFFDRQNSVFLYSSNNSGPCSLFGASGSGCLQLQLKMQVPSGERVFAFVGSQHSIGASYVQGVYSSSVFISSSDVDVAAKLAASASVSFTSVWCSSDGSVPYVTGSSITFNKQSTSGAAFNAKKYVASVHNVSETYFVDDTATFRVHIADASNPLVTAARLPAITPGLVIRDVHYQVRDVVTNVIEVPFDVAHNSTRLSNDADGMFFKINMKNLTKDRTYVIDLLVTGASRQIIKQASQTFRASNTM